MDELKIQLESRQDFEYLKEEFRKYLKEADQTTDTDFQEKFVEEVFGIVKENVQIDGTDMDKLPPEDDGEQVDPALEARLEEMQLETDRLLVQVARLRRLCPEMAREAFMTSVQGIDAQAQSAMEGPTCIHPTPPTASPLDENGVERLADELQKLRQLEKSIPDLVSKLQRAQTVLTDAAKQRPGSEGGVTEGENLSDLLNRQLGIARQHKMASKLLNQL